MLKFDGQQGDNRRASKNKAKRPWTLLPNGQPGDLSLADGTRGGGGDNSEFITLQDASREFNVYPSTVRAWEREGLIAPEHLVNIRVQRAALIRAIELANRPAEPKESGTRPSAGEIALARRILEICTSDTDKTAKLSVIESVAQSVLNRLPK